MDVDELLQTAELPRPPVDTSAALQRTLERGRARRQRRRVAVGVLSALAVVGTLAVVLDARQGSDPVEVVTGPTVDTFVPSVAEAGDVAIWVVDPDHPPVATDTTFTALVTRLGCSSGVTGDVRRPGVVVRDTDMTVTFTVAPLDLDVGEGADCQGNDQVAYQVDLGQPLGDRALIDGSCDGEAARTTFCADPVRWEPETLTGASGPPHECEAPEGSATDVAHEPARWRGAADYEDWTDRTGCLLRIDVLAERLGPEHCGWEQATVLITGQPLGMPYTTPSDTTEYVRDPEGVFDDPALTAGFDPDADLPAEAVDTGYRRGGAALWRVPGDPSAVWLVAGSAVERWPAGDAPGCA